MYQKLHNIIGLNDDFSNDLVNWIWFIFSLTKLCEIYFENSDDNFIATKKI